MINPLTLIGYACSAFALIYGLWFANSMYFGFSFVPSKLEKILKINVGTKADIENFKDNGGLDKDPAYYGLDIGGANFKYDEKTNKLIGWDLLASYKTTGILSAAAPADVRAALNKACNATDSQWIMNNGFMTYKGNNLICLYHKDNKGYLLSVSFEPTSITAPITNSAPIVASVTNQFICGDANAIALKLKDSQPFYGDVISTVTCDDDKQKTTAEMLICNNPNLRLAEKLSAVSYTYAHENATKQEVNHATFAKQNLTAQQNACKDESCLCDIFKKAADDAYGDTSPYVKNGTNQRITPSSTTPVTDAVKPLLSSNESDFWQTRLLKIYKQNEEENNLIVKSSVGIGAFTFALDKANNLGGKCSSAVNSGASELRVIQSAIDSATNISAKSTYYRPENNPVWNNSIAMTINAMRRLYVLCPKAFD